MVAPGKRIVAELGRPETPEETADRKAASSSAYRSSKTFRNLLAAMLATLAIVAVIVLAVPRGEAVGPPQPSVAEVAATVEASYDRPVLVPVVPEEWRVNRAAVEGDGGDRAWTIIYASGEAGYLRVAQAFDADEAWDIRTLSGAASDGTVTVDGVEWDRYDISDPATAGNVSYALGTQAGDDRVLIYGSTDAETAAIAAEGVADQIRELQQGAE